MTAEKTLIKEDGLKKTKAPPKIKNRFFKRACAPILVAALAVGGSQMAGCETKERYDDAEFLADVDEAFAKLDAAMATNLETARSAIEAAANEKANEALVSGVATGNLRMIKKALADGADVNARNDDGANALMIASLDGNKKIVGLLIENGADVNADLVLGVTALMGAVDEGNKKIAEKLIENGADVNAIDDEGWSALAYAIGNKRADMASVLIKNGADVNLIVRNAGGSLLTMAVGQEDLLMVKTLVENGANLEACDSLGLTPFLAAALGGNLKILQYLRARGANTKAMREGKNAITIAIGEGNVTAAEFLLKIAAPEEFEGVNELREAARLGNVGLAKKLVAKGADFRETEWIILTRDGVETPLMSAASAGKAKMVEYLLKTPFINAKDAKNEYGQTALMMAASNGNKRCVRLLLDAHVDMNARDSTGKAALSYAEDNKDKGAYELLLSEGAKY